MAPPNVAWLSSQHTVVWGKMEKVERISRYVAPPWVTSLLKSILFVLCPLLVKVMFPSNVSVLLTFAEMAPPCIAELLLKLLVPVKLSEILVVVKIAPPLLFAELPLKMLVPLKLSTTFFDVRIAPPLHVIC